MLKSSGVNKALEKHAFYYQKALDKIRGGKSKNIEYRVLEAKSLYFVGKKPESISKHREILAKNRNNKTLKADIAHFFMDVGELKEAEDSTQWLRQNTFQF